MAYIDCSYEYVITRNTMSWVYELILQSSAEAITLLVSKGSNVDTKGRRVIYSLWLWTLIISPESFATNIDGQQHVCSIWCGEEILDLYL